MDVQVVDHIIKSNIKEKKIKKNKRLYKFFLLNR